MIHKDRYNLNMNNSSNDYDIDLVYFTFFFKLNNFVLLNFFFI